MESTPPHAHGEEDLSLLEQLAEFSESAGEFSSAMEYYEQIFRLAEKARESSELMSQIRFKMAKCYARTGEYARALEALDEAVAQLPQDASDLDRCRIQNERAFALMSLGDYAAAEDCVRSVTEGILDPSATRELARAQKSFGVISMWRGDWPAASRAFEAALAGYRLIEDRSGTAQCLNNMGLLAKNRGRNQEGIRHLTEALKLHEDLGDTPLAGSTLMNLGLLEFKVGQWESARERWEKATRLLEGIGHKWEVARIALHLGNYYRFKRDWVESAAQYARAESIARELGEARELVLVKEFQGDLAFSSESFDEARSLYLESLEAGEALAPKGDLVLESYRRLADLECVSGNLDLAKTYLERGFEISREMTDDFERGILHRIEARIAALEGDHAAAAVSYENAMASHEKWGAPFEMATTQVEYATFCLENIVDLELAGAHLREARRTFEAMGADYEAGHAYLLSAKFEMACETPSGEARDHLEAAMDLLDRVGDEDDQEAVQEVHRDIDRLLAEASLSEDNDLAALNAVVARTTVAKDTPARVRTIEDALRRRTQARRVAVLRFAGDGVFEMTPGSTIRDTDLDQIRDSIRLLQGSAKLNAKPLVSTSPARDPRFVGSLDENFAKLGSVLFLPLFANEELVGGLYADREASESFFDQAALDFVVALANTAAVTLQKMHLESVLQENSELRKKLAGRSGVHGIITQSRRMLEILDLVDRLKDTDATVLLSGETGTGKELMAHAIHASSARRESDLVIVNCAALSRDVLESELFGHLKGAFTDAKADKVGLFEKADGSTIFLDEIDKTSRAFQERLLRVVDQGEVKPVGASQVRRVDVRIVCATNQSLKDMVEAGTFLKDLYYRLRVIGIELPPLRVRKEDVPLLAEHFLNQFSEAARRENPGLTETAMSTLVAHDWPGNVRDLRHEIERAVAMVPDGRPIDATDLSSDLRPAPAATQVTLGQNQSLQDLIEGIERDVVVKALRKTAGNRSQAARMLGLSRRGLLNKISRYSIDL